MLRLTLQYGSIPPLRLGQAAGSMLLEREREVSIDALLRHSLLLGSQPPRGPTPGIVPYRMIVSGGRPVGRRGA